MFIEKTIIYFYLYLDVFESNSPKYSKIQVLMKNDFFGISLFYIHPRGRKKNNMLSKEISSE